MIAGLYGMNFEHMPELKWEFGYPAVLAVILVDLPRSSTGASGARAG